MSTTIIIQNGATTGGLFPPRGPAADFFATCVKLRPGTHSGALFDFQDQLPQVGEALSLVANGMSKWIGNVTADLPNMDRGMFAALLDTWKPLATAANRAQHLPSDFNRCQAADVARRNQRNAQTANVPTRV